MIQAKKHLIFFNADETNKLALLGIVASKNIQFNDKRVANALCEALDILKKKLSFEEFSNITARRNIIKDFKRRIMFSEEELFDEATIALLNTGQYGRGLDVCDIFLHFEMADGDEIDVARAEFLCRMGKIKEAEQMLLKRLEKEPDDVWSYINLGDLYGIWPLQNEFCNLEKADYWYYKAYDRGLGNRETEDGRELIERLVFNCISRLRQKTENELLNVFEKLSIGSWKTVIQLKESIRMVGYDSPLFNHMQGALFNKTSSIDEANKYLQVLMDFYNLQPQERLDGLSPFEMVEYMPQGEYEIRIRNEMTEDFMGTQKDVSPDSPAGAEFSDKFSEFQIRFMDQKDFVTGKKRRKVIDDERKKTAKKFERGELPWMGFLKYRSSF